MLHWLLIITMMIQPALFSHAMASMEHGSAATQMQGDDLHHASHDTGSDHFTHDGKQPGTTVDNCCHTPACGPALVVDVVLVLQPPRTFYPRVVDHSLYGIDLPVSIKPPRTAV